jgi:peptide/nickel transport system substrate-binding protein
MDFFAFWHSSQRNDPGLNIAMYTNANVDKLLSDARTTLDASTRISKYNSFAQEVQKDVPAIFLYSPEYIYITPAKVQGFTLGTVTLPFERFLDINNWYIETNNLWKIFLKQ